MTTGVQENKYQKTQEVKLERILMCAGQNNVQYGHTLPLTTQQTDRSIQNKKEVKTCLTKSVNRFELYIYIDRYIDR